MFPSLSKQQTQQCSFFIIHGLKSIKTYRIINCKYFVQYQESTVAIGGGGGIGGSAGNGVGRKWQRWLRQQSTKKRQQL
jgi:hypothetical protein